jgi:hypothetical protein
MVNMQLDRGSAPVNNSRHNSVIRNKCTKNQTKKDIEGLLAYN